MFFHHNKPDSVRASEGWGRRSVMRFARSPIDRPLSPASSNGTRRATGPLTVNAEFAASLLKRPRLRCSPSPGGDCLGAYPPPELWFAAG